MVNSFGQFTGDVRVSGHISQAGEWMSVCWTSKIEGRRGLQVKMLSGCGAVSLRPGCTVFPTPWCLASQRTRPMEPACRNDKKIHWAHRVGGKRNCFANEVRKRGCGLLGSRVSARVFCHTKSSIRSCQQPPSSPPSPPPQVKWLIFSMQQVYPC